MIKKLIKKIIQKKKLKQQMKNKNNKNQKLEVKERKMMKKNKIIKLNNWYLNMVKRKNKHQFRKKINKLNLIKKIKMMIRM